MKTGQRKFSVRSSVGFSITELMVVVVIVGILAAMSLPRMRVFIASARQGEAKANVGLIAKLQHLHMSAKESYVDMGTPVGDGATAVAAAGTHGRVGYIANGTANKCDNDKAMKIGFNPNGCEDFRYSYWVKTGTWDGVDRFVVGAYAPSASDARIFPTCDGSKREGTSTARVKVKLEHSKKASSGLEVEGPLNGDVWSMDDERSLQSNSIITVCSGESATGENVGP